MADCKESHPYLLDRVWEVRLRTGVGSLYLHLTLTLLPYVRLVSTSESTSSEGETSNPDLIVSYITLMLQRQYIYCIHYSVLQHGVNCAECVCTRMYCSESLMQASFGPSSLIPCLLPYLPLT